MRLPHSLSTAGSATEEWHNVGHVATRKPRASISHSLPLMKAIRSAVVEQRNWKQEMYQFLRQYRATRPTSTKFSPHRLLFSREPGTKLPRVSTEDNHDNRSVHAAARENDKQAKQCQKTYADNRNKAEHNNLHVGDMVLMRNDKRSNKLSSAFSHKPMVVTDVRGTAVTAADDKHTIRRNTSRFKKVLDPLQWFKEMGVEKSMSLLGQSCRQHRM